MSFWVGILCGLAVGAVLALLYTPASGEQMQKEVRGRIDQVFEEAKREREATESRLRQEAGLLGIQIDSDKRV